MYILNSVVLLNCVVLLCFTIFSTWKHVIQVHHIVYDPEDQGHLIFHSSYTVIDIMVANVLNKHGLTT